MAGVDNEQRQRQHPYDSWENALVRVSNFATRPYFKPALFTCLGQQWKLYLDDKWNVGVEGADARDEGMMSVHIVNCSMMSIAVNVAILIKDTNGSVHAEKIAYYDFPGTHDHKVGKAIGIEERQKGWEEYVERRRVLELLSTQANGTLTVEVRMTEADQPMYSHDDRYSENFAPQNPIAKNISSLFMDEDTADVSFEVQGTTIHAHRLLLKASSSTLASLCGIGGDKSTPVPIEDTSAATFRCLIRYIYGGEIVVNKSNAKDLLEAADRYGIIELKLKAEAVYVKHCNMQVENAVELLLYADGKNCALLKEAAMNFIVNNVKDVMATDSFDSLPKSEGVVKEIFSCLAMSKNEDNGNEMYRMMPVNDLRTKLYEKGLDVDGSRDMLVARLEATHRGKKRKLGG